VTGVQTCALPICFYSQESDKAQAKLLELGNMETLLEERVNRWGELESTQDSLRPG
jgi:hypothetical protein